MIENNESITVYILSSNYTDNYFGDVIEELTINELFNRYNDYSLEQLIDISKKDGYLSMGGHDIVFPNSPELYNNWRESELANLKTVIRNYNISKL